MRKMEIIKGSDIRLAFQMGYTICKSETTGRLYAFRKSWIARFLEKFEI